LGISVIQAAGFARFVQSIPGAVSQPGLGFTVRTITVMTMGSLLLMWLGERAVAGVEDDAAVSAALAAEQEPA
jgi:preprotein translocase subunit SecY